MTATSVAIPNFGRHLQGRPIADWLTFAELEGLAALVRLAARGAAHENHTATASRLMEEATWLDGKVRDRIRGMTPPAGGLPRG